MQKKLAAGDNIAALCTKCKLGLDHAIVAMVEGTIAKVKCKTCGSVHKFKDPSSPAPKARVPRAKAGSSVQTVQATWETALAGAKGSERTYAMTAKYRVGDIVNHASFGKGVVLKIHVSKCDILFQDRERLMVSANL